MVVIEKHKHSVASTNLAGTMDVLLGELSELFVPDLMVVIEGDEGSTAWAMDMLWGEVLQFFASDALVLFDGYAGFAVSTNWVGTVDRLLGKGSNELFAFGLHLAVDGHKSFAVSTADFSNKYGCMDRL